MSAAFSRLSVPLARSHSNGHGTPNPDRALYDARRRGCVVGRDDAGGVPTPQRHCYEHSKPQAGEDRDNDFAVLAKRPIRYKPQLCALCTDDKRQCCRGCVLNHQPR